MQARESKKVNSCKKKNWFSKRFLSQDTVSPKPSKTLPSKGAMAPRPSSPAESVMEISHVSKSSYGEKPSSDSSNTVRPVSPAESILELPQVWIF